MTSSVDVIDDLPGKPPSREDEIPRELNELLVSFAMAIHRFGLYPAGHPSLAPVAERMVVQLSDLHSTRVTLTVGVSRAQLFVDGGATPAGHPVLGELAERIHNHQLGALLFRRGIELDELADALGVLARDPVRTERPLGLLPPRERPVWPHVRLLPLEYDALRLADEGRDAPRLPVRDLWLSILRALVAAAPTLADEVGVITEGEVETDLSEDAEPHGTEPAFPEEEFDVEPLPSAARMATLFQRWVDAGGGREDEILEALIRLVGELQWEVDQETSDMRLRASELLRSLPLPIIERLFRVGGDAAARRSVLLSASRAGLRADAVMHVLDAFLAVDDRKMSEPLTRLLGKFSRRGEVSRAAASRSEARSALRESLERMLESWAEESARHYDDPDVIEATWARSGEGEPVGEDFVLVTPVRALDVVLDVTAPDETLEAMLAGGIHHAQVGDMLDRIEEASSDSEMAARVEALLLRPDRLDRFLMAPDVDEAALRRLVDALGDEALDSLFAALVESESRSVRRKVFDRLATLGPRITSRILPYLRSDAWYVRRNMLVLLQRLPSLPDGFSPMPHIRDVDVRNRREAYPVAFRDAGAREEAITLALRESDERILRLALLELQDGLVESAVDAVIRRILESDQVPHLRSLAARALGGSRSEAARDALIRLATEEKGFLSKKRRLAPPSPDLYAALHALRTAWSDDPVVSGILSEAAASDDSRIRAAVKGVGG